jgi:hypothetical protein
VTPSSTACVKGKENGGTYGADGPVTSSFEHGSYPGPEQRSLAWVFVNELVEWRLLVTPVRIYCSKQHSMLYSPSAWLTYGVGPS